MRTQGWLLGAGLGAALLPGVAVAGDDEDLPARFRYPGHQPTVDSGQPVADPAQPVGLTAPFGSPGTRWWTVGAGVGHDFNGSTDTNLNFSYSYFLAQDVEFAAETAGWHFNQSGENTHGASLAMVFRWHFVNTGPWTVYGDAGIGFLIAEDVVPEGGTSFDLMPRVGAGFTRALGTGGVRLQGGVRWHHISNARIHGEENNPARDQPLLYVGVIFPF